MISAELGAKEAKLRQSLRDLDSVIVAYSGGVDSSLLAYYARQELKEKALVVIAVSPSLAVDDLNFARAQAEHFAWDLLEISTDEVSNPLYATNDARRCYYCKSTLFAALEKIAGQRAIKHIAYGANFDDLSDYRPGQIAAREYNVLGPLLDAGLSKEEIRDLARLASLPSWNKPQSACLASRFPTFEKVTVEGLHQVDQAEAYLRSLGFQQLRVRHHGDLARIEVDRAELKGFLADTFLLEKVSLQLKGLGYRYVTVDLEPYRQGSANRLLAGFTQAGE